jgi:hypothetical protein
MSTESTAVSAVTDEAIEREAARLIASSAAKNGISIDAIPEDAKQQAREYARANLEREAARLVTDESSPYRKMYSESAERVRQLEAQLSATQESRVRNDEHVIVTTADAVQRRDPLAWHKMTIQQRLASVGVDPATVDKAEVARFFGKDSDHKAASDLHRSNQRRYKLMKESARILGIL